MMLYWHIEKKINVPENKSEKDLWEVGGQKQSEGLTEGEDNRKL